MQGGDGLPTHISPDLCSTVVQASVPFQNNPYLAFFTNY